MRSYRNLINKNNSVMDSSVPYTREKIDIWLVVSYGDIFIKSLKSDSQNLTTADLTITSSSLKQAIKDIEDSWKILCSIDNLDKIYSFDEVDLKDGESPVCNHGYVLNTNLDAKKMNLITKSCSGKFIEYRNFEDEIKPYQKTLEFNEAFYSLLAWADNAFSYELRM